MKVKSPFTKNEHIQMIKAIALGMKQAGFLNRYLEIGIKKGNCFNQIAPLCKESYAVDILDCKKLINHNTYSYIDEDGHCIIIVGGEKR